MRINDIAIGSWVRGYWEEGSKDAVGGERLYRDFKVADILGRLEEVESEEGEIFHIDDCEGIPLTEDILKANFKQGAMDNLFYSHRLKLYIWNIGNVTFTIKTADVAKICVDYYCSHVHELQCALRLCGLNNIADNLKLS